MGKEIKHCVIISGAPEINTQYYFDYITENTFIICADSGYTKCHALKITPDLIIGDFDSSDLPITDCELIKLNSHKDDTDTFHCVKEAINRGFNEIYILGGIGSRVDHTYSNILSLNYCFDNNIRCYLVDGRNSVSIFTDEAIINNKKYDYFSLFALFEKCEGLSIKNAEYELDNIDLNPYDQFTQSNACKEGECKITVKKGKILLVQSND